jgi:hypothetical protein
MVYIIMNSYGLKLGKLSVKYDKRTLKLSDLYRKGISLPEIPSEYLIDSAMGIKFPIQMLGNDSWGDCVIVGRANLTIRFEYHECQYIVPISIDDCLNEYWHEQGSNDGCWLLQLFHSSRPDNGLVMLDSLNEWRKNGWVLDGLKYDIYAYASLNKQHHKEVMQSIYFLNGAYMGFSVSQSAMNQFHNGEIWDVTDIDSPIEGGHCVALNGYNNTGPLCLTWGKQQQMTWGFFDKYCDEVYGVIDNKDNWIVNNLFDPSYLSKQLDVITA